MFLLIVTLKEKVYPPLEVSDYTGEMELCTGASDVTRPMINTIHSLKTSVTAQKKQPTLAHFLTLEISLLLLYSLL